MVLVPDLTVMESHYHYKVYDKNLPFDIWQQKKKQRLRSDQMTLALAEQCPFVFSLPRWCDNVMTLSFQTDRSGQTVQTQIRLLLEEQSDQGLHCLLFHLHLFLNFR